MGAILGWCVAGVLALCTWWIWRRFAVDWRHLEQLLDELANGRKPGGFVFRHGGRFGRLTYPLEKIAQEQDKLHREIHDEAFNLRTILASMEEGVMVVDTHHNLRLVNPSFLSLFDLKCDPVGQSVLRTLRETAFEEIITAALRTGQPQRGDVERTSDKRHFAVHAVPVKEFSGGPGIVAIIRDITRLRQLEEVRREFVANVSHELRTPLSIFHGYLENLLDAPSMPRKDQTEIFEILRKHSRRLNALLEDLLTLARLESRQEKIACVSMKLPALLRSIGGDWSQKLANKKLALQIEAHDDLPRISADPQRLEQVLHNLLENAVKYTEPGGNIFLRAAAQNGHVEVRVEDSGQGIPPADLPHIFERFYRADKARSREQGGTGLGLSIVKHIIQLHGGTVAAESKYGKGTTIILHLPLDKGEE
ncbi:PAS/PAC sensor signal transduction histidine kinase [Chthoniobacter flavus Ellin428]|uniref:histidine kinase n=1 Tax=Chthoniobacter flavus Ellin428 TaxID=497964 RepID=B4D4U6_9BACT|nr:ATP-binding protein [Chthoniobacter flavus]EDY18549.1 PAS/PAC sensor signal transduction histidine kinase [Chthoniobacter flavus Ellin428]TCO90996.1 two-component system phosphate regulon sensor histidine kinase PhoR [Chthoniobacter flavus]